MSVFLPVRHIFTGNPSFSSTSNQKTLDIELIRESAKIYAFDLPAGLLIDVLFLSQHKLPNSCVPLPNMCFHENICKTTLGEFTISLVLVISCEPGNVETESRNFSALEAQCFYRWQQNMHPCSNIIAYVHRDIGFAVLIVCLFDLILYVPSTIFQI